MTGMGRSIRGRAITRPGCRWKVLDRVVVLLVVPVFVLGTPGFGPENREFSNSVTPALMAVALFAPPVGALLLSWMFPFEGAAIGAVGGVVLAITAVADLFGLIVGTPPAGMVWVDSLMFGVAAAIAWRCVRIVRA